MYDNRPDWDNYFMEIAQVVSKRSTCLRRSVGAVIVKNRQIVATGYNGTPSKLEHCSVTGCLREQLKVPSGQMQNYAAVSMLSRMPLFRPLIMAYPLTEVRCIVLISRVLSVLKY